MPHPIVRTIKPMLLAVAASTVASPIVLGNAFLAPKPGVLYEVVIAAIAVCLWAGWKGSEFSAAPARTSASLQLALSCALLFLGLSMIRHYWTSEEATPLLGTLVSSRWTKVSTGIAMVITAPLAEEAIFRGYLLKRLCEHVRRPSSVALSAVVFAAAHWDPSHALEQFAAGAVLGVIVVQTGRVWLAVLAHGAMNLLAFIDLVVPDGRFANELGIVLPLAGLLIAIVCSMQIIRTLRSADWSMVDGSYRGVVPPVTWNPDPISE